MRRPHRGQHSAGGSADPSFARAAEGFSPVDCISSMALFLSLLQRRHRHSQTSPWVPVEREQGTVEMLGPAGGKQVASHKVALR